MSVVDHESVEDLRKLDELETDISFIKGAVETVQAAVTSPHFSPEAAAETLDGVLERLDNVKVLIFGLTPT